MMKISSGEAYMCKVRHAGEQNMNAVGLSQKILSLSLSLSVCLFLSVHLSLSFSLSLSVCPSRWPSG